MLFDPSIPLVVSYHTIDPVYSAAADRLRESLRKFNLPHLIHAVPRPPGLPWLAGCAMKSELCLFAQRTTRHSIIWVDADAEVLSDPRPQFRSLVESGCDVAAYMNRKADGGSGFPLVNSNLCSGTVYFSASSTATLLLQNWYSVCAASGATVYDQELLYARIREIPYAKTFNLDPALCCVRDLMPGVKPVIVQHQASRQQGSLP